MFTKTYNSLVTLYYLCFACWGIRYLLVEVDKYINQSKLFHYAFGNVHKYLSIWTIVLQEIYFIIVSFLDLVDSFPSVFKCPVWSRYCKSARHYLLTSLVLPLTLHVFTMFWSIYLYDREIVFPEQFDRFFPPWINHVVHTLPVPFILIHLIINPNINPSRKSALVGLTLFFIVYGVVFGASALSGNWVYLTFINLSYVKRMILFAINYPMMIAFLIFSRGIRSFVKGKKEKYVLKEIKQN